MNMLLNDIDQEITMSKESTLTSGSEGRMDGKVTLSYNEFERVVNTIRTRRVAPEAVVEEPKSFFGKELVASNLGSGHSGVWSVKRRG